MAQDDDLARRARELLDQRRGKEEADRREAAERDAAVRTYLQELQPQIRKLFKDLKVAPNESVPGPLGLSRPLWKIPATYQNDPRDNHRPFVINLFERKNGIWVEKGTDMPVLTDEIRKQISESIAQFAAKNASRGMR